MLAGAEELSLNPVLTESPRLVRTVRISDHVAVSGYVARLIPVSERLFSVYPERVAEATALSAEEKSSSTNAYSEIRFALFLNL